ncbi:MAG: YebC/PmpR family DNA-binding transcriptional regulator [bacterium]|nr:YebC/PmpR family DNA-binding transcriptional regulator [bacterium]
MSGHNRWSQIKRQKGKTDAAKSKIFGKFAKSITDEAKKSGGNRNSPGLKTAIERAKAENMPNDNIERAIKRATEQKTAMEAIVYEAYGPGGVAMLIEALTDNRNKAAQEVKFILSKNGYSLAAQGSALWAFTKQPATGEWKPTTTIALSEDDIVKLEALAEELENNDEVQEVVTNAE